MTAQEVRYRWTRSCGPIGRAYSADRAGVFNGRVELVDGEVWPVVVGNWHRPTTMRLAYLLTAPEVLVTSQSLPTGDSLPDLDLWLRLASARPACSVARRLSRRDATDVLHVRALSDKTVAADPGARRSCTPAAATPSTGSCRTRPGRARRALPRRSTPDGRCHAGSHRHLT